MVKENNSQKNALLRIRLAEFDMSFAELARRSGLHPLTISRVYHGSLQLSCASATRVADVLNTTPKKIGLCPSNESEVAK